MLKHIEDCIPDKPIILQKPYNSLPGTRVITANHFNDPAQRLTLFRHLKSKDYAVKQLRAQSKDRGPATTDIEVMLPTVTNR